MKKKPQPAASQKKRSKKQTSATHPSQATDYPPASSQPPSRTSSLTALEMKARNAKYYKSDASLPPPILSGQTRSHYPVRSTSFPSQPPPQAKQTTYNFSSSTPQTTQLQSLLSVLSSPQNRNSVLSVLSLMDASKSSSVATSSVGSTPNSKEAEDAFATALKSLLSAASAASTSANPVPPTNLPVALLAPPPDKLNDLPSPSSSGEDDTVTPKPSAGSTPEDSSHACASPEVRRKVAPDKENVHPSEHSTPSKSEKPDGEKVLSPAASPSRPLGRSNTMTSPIRPIDVSSSSRRKRTISDVGDVSERVRDKVRLLRGSNAAGSTTLSFDDVSTDPLEGVKRRLFSLSSHYTAQYHSDPTFDSLPPSSSQESTSPTAGDCDTKLPIHSSSSSFIRSNWATAKVKNTNLVESDSPTLPVAANAEGKKRFVVPDWAKTQTATVPRLSDEAAAKLEAAEVERTNQMKINKKARSAAARKRKLEQMVAEDENIDRLPPSAKLRGKQKQEQTKAEDQEKSLGLGLKNASNKPETPKKDKPGTRDSEADLPLVASSSPLIFNSSPLASRSRDLVLKTPTRRRRNSSPSRTPTKRSVLRAASESPLFTPDGTTGGITPKKLPSLFSTISPLRKGRKSPSILKPSSSSSAVKRIVIDLERDEDEGSMNSLPNPSSDIDEPEAPVGPLRRLADPELLSSSPPPSSPIMTSSDVGLPPPEVVTSESSETEAAEEGKFEWFTASTLACHPPSTANSQPSENDFADFMLQVTSSSRPPTAPSPSDVSAAKFASEIFDWGSDDTLAGSSSATPFDDFEFLEDSDPILPDVAQPLPVNLGFDYGSLGMDNLGGLADVGAEFGIGEFWQSVKPLMEQNSLVSGGTPGVDAGISEGGSVGEVTGGGGVKLASGMVDLFGGCLV